LKKELWKQEMPKGFRAHKYVAGPDGEYKRDPSYVGENAWATETNETVEQVVASGNLNDEEKAELLEFLNEGRAEKGLPLYDSDFKVEGPDNSSLENSNGIAAGQFLGLINLWFHISYVEILVSIHCKVDVSIPHGSLPLSRSNFKPMKTVT